MGSPGQAPAGARTASRHPPPGQAGPCARDRAGLAPAAIATMSGTDPPRTGSSAKGGCPRTGTPARLTCLSTEILLRLPGQPPCMCRSPKNSPQRLAPWAEDRHHPPHTRSLPADRARAPRPRPKPEGSSARSGKKLRLPWSQGRLRPGPGGHSAARGGSGGAGSRDEATCLGELEKALRAGAPLLPSLAGPCPCCPLDLCPLWQRQLRTPTSHLFL